ncbi:MAG: PD40 domain-containing protein [Acidobacteria bacterium]|nr:PD40 domain-containing protein [Acidobacteriota bacterium]
MSDLSKRFAILAITLSASAVYGDTDRIAAQTKSTPGSLQSQAKKSATTPAAAPAPNSPVSTHYPILLLAFGPPEGPQTGWSIRIGIKGPERMDRPNYPPVTLEPIDVTREGTNDEWTYRAKDSATGADVSVHLTRESCSPANEPAAKYTFRVIAQHGQIGTLNGCARIAAELFPKINNQPDPDDEDKIPAVLPVDIIKFQLPTDIAYIAGTKVTVGLGKIRKVAAQDGSEPSLSHDGRKLLYTRPDTKTGPDRTIVLYDTTTGRSQDLVHGGVREAFWSPDDTRVAYLNYQDQKWQLYIFSAGAPQQGTPVFTGSLTSLHGWIDAHTLLASDMQSVYWITDDGRTTQTLPLKEIYGDEFDVTGSDTFRVNPINSDLLLVAAPYVKAPAGAPTDQMGLAAAIFLYEVKSKRRTLLSPSDQWARHGEWSRDGVQIFYTRRLTATSYVVYRQLWDGSEPKRFQEGADLVVGK